MSETGDRYNVGKAKLSYLMQFPNATGGVCKVAEFGAVKYARYNWKKGLVHSEIVDSLLRHLTSYSDGENVDPDSGQLHVDHITWNAMALAEMVRTHPQLDDRECTLVEKETNPTSYGPLSPLEKEVWK